MSSSPTTLANIISNLPGHVYWKDLDGVYVSCNDTQAVTLGYEKGQQIVGKTDFELPWHNTAEALRSVDAQIVATGEEKILEETVELPGGKTAVFLSHKKPFYDNEGQIIGILGTSTNITAQKKIQAELEETKEKLKASSNYLVHFFDVYIRDQLSTLTLGLDVLSAEAANNKPLLNAMQQSSKSIEPVLSQVSYYARLMVGQEKGLNSDIALLALIEKLKHIHETPLIPIEIQCANTLPPLVSGNYIFVKEILNILVSNAVRYAGGKSILIEADTINQKQNDVTLQIKITNTGTTLPDSIKQAIKQLFYSNNEHTSNPFCTGMKLSIVKLMVEILGGQIDVESNTTNGTTFSICVPFKLKQIEKQKQLDHCSPNFTKHHGASTLDHVLSQLASKPKVLIFEESKLEQLVFSAFFELLNCEIEFCSHFSEIQQKASQQTYDFLFISLNNFNRSALALIEEIKQNQDINAETPCIGITSLATEEGAEFFHESCLDELLVKPLSREKLEAVIHVFLLEKLHAASK
ncbi:MAG: hybrid sensor histidine kinase/response regulator [marine bacterium B5-7]|nr:MAG: hybrid sensor histidine kinase/response regulator [marine bacterium B5-7]